MRRTSRSSRCPIVTDSSPTRDQTSLQRGRTDSLTAVAQRFARLVGGTLVVLGIGAFLIACGNESSNGDTGEPPSQTVNPCPTPAVQPSRVATVQQRPSKASGVLQDPDPRTALFNVFWNQRSAIARGTLAPLPTIAPTATLDV